MRAGPWFGGAALAVQQVDASRTPVNDVVFVAEPGPCPLQPGVACATASQTVLPAAEQTHGNELAFASLGRTVTGTGLSVGGSVLWARLTGVDGVDVLYARSVRVKQFGHTVDFRLGALQEWRGERSLEALLLYDRFGMTHDVTYLHAFWDPGTQRFYQAIPETKAHPGGALAVIDPRAMTVTALYPVASCQPHGLAVGPADELLLGCSSGKDARSIILNLRTGAVVATLTQVGGSDQVWYNPGDHRYYLAARENPGEPVLGVIDARTHQWLRNIPTAKNAHSVAVNTVANEVFVPLTPNPACAKGCVAVYRVGP